MKLYLKINSNVSKNFNYRLNYCKRNRFFELPMHLKIIEGLQRNSRKRLTFRGPQGFIPIK